MYTHRVYFTFGHEKILVNARRPLSVLMEAQALAPAQFDWNGERLNA